MNKVLVQIYQTTASKYIKFRKRLQRNISKGRFRKFTKRKQSQLLSKVERLRRRLAQLEMQLRLAGTGAALSLILHATPADAQTTIGPFQRNYLGNPLPPPLRYIENPNPAYIDLDGDADLDLIVGDDYSQKLFYFKNIGTKDDPYFLEIESTDPDYPFSAINTAIGTDRSSWSPAFADVDMDGDYDLLVGTDKYTPIHEGKTFFFRNNGTALVPDLAEDTNNNPFAAVQSYRLAHPTFADVDNDGDVDLILGGYYDTSTYHYLIQFYKNDKVNPTDPNEAPNFVQQNSNHPFAFNNINDADAAPVSFADLDKDGDLDFFFSIYGQIHYRRNDGNGVFTDQTGPWIPDAGNPGNSSGNPFNTINLVDPFNFVFSDLDNDGDLDATVGYYLDNSSGPEDPRPFLYYENVGQGVLQIRQELKSPVDGIDLGNNANASFVDLDTDGDLDMITSGSLTYTTCPDNCYTYVTDFISVYRNDSGKFIDITNTPADKISNLNIQPAPKIKLIDVNGDGALDLVIPYFDAENFGSGSVQYFKNVSGTYVEQTGPSNPFAFIGSGIAFNIDVADLDGDLDLDLIVGQPGATLKTYENTGTLANPTFTLNTTWDDGFLTTGPGNNPVILDLDHDGDKDIIVGVLSNITFYRNDGTPAVPSFTEFIPSSNENPFGGLTLSTLPSPSFVDLDGDGDKDLLIGDYSGQFSFFENSNPAPATSLAAQTLVYDPTSGSINIDLNPGLTDADNDKISGATITIQSFQAGKEQLDFTPQAGITGTFNTSTGILTLSGLASVSTYKTALQSITYKFIGSKPAQSGRKSASNGRTITLSRTVRFQVFDQDGTKPATAQRQIQVTFPNVVPTVAASTPSTTFIGTPVIVDPGILAADGDDSNLEGATIRINAATLQSGEDQLVFTDQNGIVGTYNATIGTLTLTGIASLANYQAAIRSVRYNNTSSTPSSLPRDISFTVTDGESPSNSTIVGISVNVSPPPVLTGTNPNVTMSPATGPVVIDSGIIVTDPDNTSLQGATVRISNFINQDQLIFNNQNGISGSYDTTSGVLTLTGSSSLANYQAALRSIQFNINSTNYDLTNRTIQFTATDGGTSSAAITATVKVANQIPTISGGASSTTFTPSSGSQVIATDLLLTDGDNTNLQTAKVLITNFSAQDELIFSSQNGITGTYNSATGELLLTGDATVANYQTALRSVRFNNPSAALILTNRAIEFSVSDGTTFSNALVTTVIIVNQTPALTLSQPTRLYSSGDLVIDNGLTVTDADNSNLQSAEIVIAAGRQSAEDVLVFVNQNGISGSYDNTTGILSLSGAATVADYQTSLRSVVYRNISSTPTKTTRTVTFSTNDGTSSSTVASLIVTINSTPVINLSTLSGNSGQKITVDLTPLISDPDNNLAPATIKILTQPTSGAQATINGSLLLSVDYQNFNFAGNDQLALEACDVTGTCTQKIVSITVNNLPPTINVTPAETVVGGSVLISLTALITDPNNNIDLSSLTISQQPISGAIASIDNNKNLIVDYAGVTFVGTDNLKVKVCDAVGACVEQTITIQVEGAIEVFNGISANGDTRNSYFELKNITVLEPSNKVSIYSRWGDKVFEVDNYDNKERRFEGVSDSGKELTSGTYFYKVEFTSGRKALTGYLTIKR